MLKLDLYVWGNSGAQSDALSIMLRTDIEYVFNMYLSENSSKQSGNVFAQNINPGPVDFEFRSKC